MANEITIQGSLSLQRSTIGLVGSGTLPINQTGTNGISNVQSIPTSNTQMSIGNVSFASGGYVFVKNLDATNYVEVGLDYGSGGS